MSESNSNTNWAGLRTLAGTAGFVPGAIDRMMRSPTREAANAAYWELDNRVIVQGQLFEASEAVAVLVSSRVCAGDFSPAGLASALDLLVELAYGDANQSEIAAGNADLGDRCREQISRRLGCVKALCAKTVDERVLLGILDLVDRLESDSEQRANFLASFARLHQTPAIRRRLGID